MKIFLAGTASRPYVIKDQIDSGYAPFILESFYYENPDVEAMIPKFGDFLLDSGAFTFMTAKKSVPDWNEYIRKYAEFINRNRIEKFFELDIDAVVGYKTVLEYRERLESLTGRQCIPVWHQNRGSEAFIEASQKYPYVAVGGLVSGGKEYAREFWKYFPWFVKTAHENGAKLHALGFTSIEGIERFHFDSVDSTAWAAGNRYGFVYRFDGRRIKIKHAPEGKKLKDPKAAALHNFREWAKYQRYASIHL